MDHAISLCKEKNSYPMFAVNDKISKLVPNPRALPIAWRWPEMRKIMMETSPLVPESQAERRALMMVNPGFRKCVLFIKKLIFNLTCCVEMFQTNRSLLQLKHLRVLRHTPPILCTLDTS